MKSNLTLAAMAAAMYPPEPAGGNARSGLVYAANEEMVQDALRSGRVYAAANDQNIEGFALSQPLTQFVTGAPDRENLQSILDALFPPVPTGMRFSYLQHDESASFIADSIGDIIRPVGGDFPVVKANGTEAEGRVYNKGLTRYVDRDQGGLLPAVQESVVANLRNRILRSELVYGLGLIDAAATAESSTNWGAADANPDGDVRASMITAGDTRGVDSNIIVFGQGAWTKRAQAYEEAERTNGGVKADYTPERLAQVLGVDRVINVTTRKRSSASATTNVIGSTVYNYFAQPGATTDDPSNVKRFVHMTEAGAMQVFIEVQQVRVKITVMMYSNIIVTSTLGIRKRAITYS
jgi:hypothetical protein